jgi:serine/threonine protein kinase
VRPQSEQTTKDSSSALQTFVSDILDVIKDEDNRRAMQLIGGPEMENDEPWFAQFGQETGDLLRAAYKQSMKDFLTTTRELYAADIRRGSINIHVNRYKRTDRDPQPIPELLQSMNMPEPIYEVGLSGSRPAFQIALPPNGDLMSPEQAKGFSADHRSDVFSFGCVLYEMLSGRQPFGGETAQEILASVLVREPEFPFLPSHLNPRLYDLLRRCLDKNPKRRWQALGDLRGELEAVAAQPTALRDTAQSAAMPRSIWKRAIPSLLSAIAAGAIVGTIGWGLRPAEPSRIVTKFSVSLPEGQGFTASGRHVLAMSPDGSRFVYAANNQLNLRSLGDMEARPIPGTLVAGAPVFSPDGQWIGFFSGQGSTLKKIPVTGGSAAHNLSSRGSIGHQLGWRPDRVWAK